MRFLALHLEPGSDVRQSLEQLAAQEGGHGFVLSVVGNLTQASFQCPGEAHPTVLAGELEIITLQGTVAAQGVHLHLSFSDNACQVWGVHLEPGPPPRWCTREPTCWWGLFDAGAWRRCSCSRGHSSVPAGRPPANR